MVNVGDGSHGAIGLLPLKRSPKNIDASIIMHPKRVGAVLDSVPIGEDQGRGGGELGGNLVNGALHERKGNHTFDPFLVKEVTAQMFWKHLSELAEARQATQNSEAVSGPETWA